jgi:hypothetical protein
VTVPQYLLSVWFDEPYDDDVDLSAPETQRQMAQTAELNAEMERAGAWVFVAGLRPASSATVVRAAGGDVSMTDGPYAETKEQMGGLLGHRSRRPRRRPRLGRQGLDRLRAAGRGPTHACLTSPTSFAVRPDAAPPP